MSKKLIYLLEPFFTGSHKQWAKGLARYSRHDIRIIKRAGRFWKWRMHGAAVSMAEEISQMVTPDAILATDMLDVAVFRGLYGREVPMYLYYHENQLTYPWSPQDLDPGLQRDRHYGWINYTSALSADFIAFNSAYHREAFFQALPTFLAGFPDDNDSSLICRLKEKSTILHLGLDLPNLTRVDRLHNSPILLWNHRWEYDKGPEAFFELCFQLEDEGIDFKLIVLGESNRKHPVIFDEAKQKLDHKIIHWGYAKDRTMYWQLLQQADIAPVTSRQDFFGISAIEAVWAGAYPIWPDRLAFAEHLPLKYVSLYKTPHQLLDICSHKMVESDQNHEVRKDILCKYLWNHQINKYDEWLDSPAPKALL